MTSAFVKGMEINLDLCRNCGWYSENNGPKCNAPTEFTGIPMFGGACGHYVPK